MSARLLAGAIFLVACPAFGQNLTVQQPIVESFSVGTTVSVPVGGTVSLGGVGRARSARNTFGPLPRRGAYSRGVSSASMSAGVFIHDFEAMDAAVLNAANGSGPRPAFTKSRYSDATSYSMSRRYAAIAKYEARRSNLDEPRERRVGELTPAARPTAFDDVGRLLALGEAAERRGNLGVAAIHYRVAAKGGSAEAERRLERLAGAKAVAASEAPPAP
jgi:hypothetical protein